MALDQLPTAMELAQKTDLRGRVAIITGATSGLGFETAKALASAGATLILGARDLVKGEATARSIGDMAGNRPHVERLDLSDLSSVREFSDRVYPQYKAIHYLIANAGVSKTPASHLPNGLDVRFATNHLGHFLLANLLKDRLVSGRARIVMVSSSGHKGKPIRFDDLQWHQRPHDVFAAYGESKTANILFAIEATRRWSPFGVFANALMPGTIMTGLQRYHGEETMRKIGFILPDGTVNPSVRTAEQGAATTVWAACAPELEGRGGLMLEDCALAEPATPDRHRWNGFDPAVMNEDDAKRLWLISEELVERHSGLHEGQNAG